MGLICNKMKKLKVLWVKILVRLPLLLVFIFWGSKAVIRYFDQPLSTDITYNFGDNREGGIQFPLISFCQPDFATQNKIMKDCSSESLDFIGNVIRCMKINKNFKMTSSIEKHQYQPSDIFSMIDIWTGKGLISLDFWKNQIWSSVISHYFGPCYTFNLSKVEEFKFLQYQGRSRPSVDFTFANGTPWNDISVIIHTNCDFPDAIQLNGYTHISNLREKRKLHKLDIRKIVSKRVSTQKIPCTQYDHQTCLNIEDSYFVLRNFNCQIPILNSGQHLEQMIPKETLVCNNEETMKAFDLIQAVKSNIKFHKSFAFP